MRQSSGRENSPRCPTYTRSRGPDARPDRMTDYLLIQALNGLVIGIIYAVIAAGLTVIFSILKIVNFAHGEVYMMGGYFAYFAIKLLGIGPLPALFVAMLIAFALSVAV